jgi:hypothetical protein
MRIVKRLIYGGLIGALPGGLMIGSTLIFRGEIALTLGSMGIVLAVFGAVVGLLVAALSPQRREIR